MGRSPEPAPVTYVTETQGPTVYQSIVPDEDFELASNYINELKAEREKTKAERYLEVGTPEEIGQRMQRRNDITEAAYESSMPKPEIDYTAGLDPARLNNLETFLKDFVDRRTGKSNLGAIKKGETALNTAPAVPKTDTAAPVRAAIAAPKPQPAPKPAPAPPPAPAPSPAPAPAPPPLPEMRRVTIADQSISKGRRQIRKSGLGGDAFQPLRHVGDDAIYRAANKAGIYNIKTPEDVKRVMENI